MDQTLTEAICSAAVAAGIPPARLLAVVEIESAGQAVETDGKTPRLLFERHIFHRYLSRMAPDKLPAAIKAGLAVPRWDRATAYRDQGSSANRLKLLARARAVDEECANLACSWGLGQTMGFCAPEIGFDSATEMVAWMTSGGVAAQVEAMVLEIKAKGLIDELEREDWAGFARAYNGPGYKANSYDTRLAAADDKWERRLASPVYHERLADFEIVAIQMRLVELGFHEVGNLDGDWGRKTTGAIASFQKQYGLPVTGDYDPATREALAAADTPAAISPSRQNTTVEDLRARGSQTVAKADQGRKVAGAIVAVGAAGGAQKAGTATGLLDSARGALDQAASLRPLVDGIAELSSWLLSSWPLVACVAGGLVWWQYGEIIKRRLQDEITGRHT